MNWSAVQKLGNSKLVSCIPIHRVPVHIPYCVSETYLWYVYMLEFSSIRMNLILDSVYEP